jgi:polysaccharide export outer membrane protein
MKSIAFFALLVFSYFLVSCKTQQKIPNYLQHVTDTTIKEDVQVPELLIQKNDLLSITVISASMEPRADAPYNLPATTATSENQSGFLVDAKGNIQYPRLGVFHAEGLTKEELAEQIKKRLTEPVKLLDEPIVIIRFLNLKVTVMGEVNSQGVIAVPGERITILEAIGLAGGTTDFGVKDAVRVMRETDGKREIGIVDLSSENLFESPYYNLRQNDIVIIDPIPRKAKKADQDIVLQRISFGLSLITAIALLYNIFSR